MPARLTILATILAIGAINADEKDRFQEIKWATTQSLGEVSPRVTQALRALFGADDRIAARGEPFDATDVVSGKPRRRFVLAGQGGGRWFVAYEKGGRGHHLVLAVFGGGAVLKPVLLARGGVGNHNDPRGWQVDLKDLQTGLKNGSLSLDDTNQPHY